MAVLLPLPITMGLVSEKKSARVALYALWALGSAYYLVMFALRRSVW